jgi:transposase
MIPLPSGVRVWVATGHTDMRRGMNSLALLVQGIPPAGAALRLI